MTLNDVAAEDRREPESPSPSRSRLREALLTTFFAAVLFVPFGLAGFWLRGGALFHRPLWLDEWHTLLIARQATLGEVLRSLARGADFNAPLLYVWQWGLARLFGGISHDQLRLTGVLSMWLALVVLFLLIRRACGALPAFAGTIAAGMATPVMAQAFDGRFYGPWMLLTVLHVAALGALVTRPRSIARQLLVCCTAVLLCSIQYLGVVVLGLTTVGAAWGAGLSRRTIATLLPGFAAGCLAVVAMIPLIRSQGTALTVPTWIASPDRWRVAYFLIPSLPVLLAVIFTVPSSLRSANVRLTVGNRVVVGALAVVALVPLVLVGVSLAFQPVTVSRYGMAYTLAAAPAVALLFARLRPTHSGLLLATLAATWLVVSARQADRGSIEAHGVAADSALAHAALRAGHLVAVTTRFTLYPLLALQGDDADLAMAVASPGSIRARFPIGSDSAYLGNEMILDRDVAEVHHSLFARPRLVPVDSLTRLPCFLLLDLHDEPAFATRWMPAATAVRIRPRLFAITPPSASDSARAQCAEGGAS